MSYYHYTSDSGLLGIIDSSKLHCTNVKFLNDSSEQTHFDNILKQVLDKNSKLKAIFNYFYNDSLKDVLTPLEYYVVSFCKNDDSLSMWNHYSKGNGYNICFDLENIIRENDDENTSIIQFDMIYNKNVQCKMLSDFINGFNDKYEDNCEIEELIIQAQEDNDREQYDELIYKQDNDLFEFNEGILEMILKFKHPSFEREEEVRLLISSIHKPDSLPVKYKLANSGVILEYFSLKIDLRTDIEGVTAHPISNNLHLIGLTKYLNSKIGKNILVKKSNIPFRLV